MQKTHPGGFFLINPELLQVKKTPKLQRSRWIPQLFLRRQGGVLRWRFELGLLITTKQWPSTTRPLGRNQNQKEKTRDQLR